MEAKECRRAGGVATMVTRGLAEFMANAALKNSIANNGWTASGPIELECKEDTLTTTRAARLQIG